MEVSESNSSELKFAVKPGGKSRQGIQWWNKVSEENPKHGGDGESSYTSSGVKTAPPCGGSHPAHTHGRTSHTL